MKLLSLTVMAALFIVNGSYAVSEDSSEFNFNELDTNEEVNLKDLFASELCRDQCTGTDTTDCRGSEFCFGGAGSWICSGGCCRCVMDTNEDLFASELCQNQCIDTTDCPPSYPSWICSGGCCLKDRFASEISNQDDFDFVYVGKSGKSGGSTHECRNSNDCRSSETCVYNRSKGYRVCRKPSTGKSCQRSNECNSKERCNDAGYCIRDNKNRKPTSGDRCNRRSDCGPHRSCSSNGYCVRRDLDLEGVMEE